ncbi:MAG: glutathione S-transferase family protein [Pseudomonadota bacterium]
MILYGSTISPFVRKVAAYCSEKEIDVEFKSVGINDPDPGFRAASPFRKMPALVDGDYALADSSAIIHYLEAKYPEPTLIPVDPKERGRVVWFDEWSDTLLFACGAKMFFNRVVSPRFLGREGDLAAADAAERDDLPALLDYLESVIPDSGYLVSERLTVADISVCSPFVNFRHMELQIDAARYPRIQSYTAAILSRPSFAPIIERETAMLSRVPA